jgi:choline dehydrogenase-like flavoprotein
MYFNANIIPIGKNLEADVCIIGSGAAGIAIALEFIGTGLKVVLLESGLRDENEYISSLYEGDAGELMQMIRHSGFLIESRTRQVGGSTNCWHGTCRPLDAIDFEKREGIPHSGWPTSYRQLYPYYERAQLVCCLDDFVYNNPQYWAERLHKTYKQTLGSLKLIPETEHVKTVIFQSSNRQKRRFQEVYGKRLEEAPNIFVWMNCNVLSFETNRKGSIVTLANAATIEGNHFRVFAKKFILAAGGIETVRILMLSDQNQATNNGIGNQHDILGRFFMVHPLLKRAADLDMNKDDWPFYTGRLIYGDNQTRICPRLAPTEKTLRESGFGNFRVFFYFSDELNKVILNLNLEQVPNPESRVSLTNKIDLLGQKRVKLDWKLTQQDENTAQWAIQLLEGTFEQLGLCQIHTIAAPGLDPGHHHIGTTRMSINPESGVVDTNCKVHQTDNLFIAGSSVFPTAGYANPTLTIIALAIRLADHIKRLI